MLNLGIKLTELGLIPESILRIAIKKLLKQRLLEIPINPEQRASQKANFLEELQSSPIALSTELANEQHYDCLLYTSPSPRDRTRSRMPSSA